MIWLIERTILQSLGNVLLDEGWETFNLCISEPGIFKLADIETELFYQRQGKQYLAARVHLGGWLDISRSNCWQRTQKLKLRANDADWQVQCMTVGGCSVVAASFFRENWYRTMLRLGPIRWVCDGVTGVRAWGWGQRCEKGLKKANIVNIMIFIFNNYK